MRMRKRAAVRVGGSARPSASAESRTRDAARSDGMECGHGVWGSTKKRLWPHNLDYLRLVAGRGVTAKAKSPQRRDMNSGVWLGGAARIGFTALNKRRRPAASHKQGSALVKHGHRQRLRRNPGGLVAEEKMPLKAVASDDSNSIGSPRSSQV
jgi:hypothetical protein